MHSHLSNESLLFYHLTFFIVSSGISIFVPKILDFVHNFESTTLDNLNECDRGTAFENKNSMYTDETLIR
jgi:hypothetical protein